MRFFFAGSESGTWSQLLKDNGVNNRLESAYYLNFKKEPNHLKFKNYLLDSGGFTLRKNNSTLRVEQYADYLNKFNVKYAFNLDTMNVDETLKNQEYLIKKCKKTNILPIYHYSDYSNIKHRSLIDSFCKEFNYIGIAGAVAPSNLERERFYNYVFVRTKNKIKVHGLAATSYNTMKNYPFYSVDSTSWLVAARYGGSNVEDCDIFNKYLNKVQDGYERSRKEIKHFLKLEKEITDIWKARGVEWI